MFFSFPFHGGGNHRRVFAGLLLIGWDGKDFYFTLVKEKPWIE